MVKKDTNLRGLFRKSTAAGLVLLLAMAGFSPVAEAGTWIRRDWSKVQRVAPGTRTRVLLYKDRAPAGLRKIEGLFKAATPEAVTLSSPSGKPHTLRKQDVTRVLVYRPISKRYPGWIALGVSAGLSIPTVARSGSDVEPWGKLLLNGAFIGGPTVVAFLATPKWGGIYNVPRKLRDELAPEPSPTAAKQDPATAGSRLLLLEDELSEPESRRSEPRRLLLRDKLLADLSSRPVHAHRFSFVSDQP